MLVVILQKEEKPSSAGNRRGIKMTDLLKGQVMTALGQRKVKTLKPSNIIQM